MPIPGNLTGYIITGTHLVVLALLLDLVPDLLSAEQLEGVCLLRWRFP